MNENYDDWADFYGVNNNKNDLNKFLKEIFESINENRPAVIRNQGCKFTEDVLCYLEDEWMIILCELDISVQARAMDLLDTLKQLRETVPTVAGKIAEMILENF
jgi:hypothetical protein